MRKRCGWTLNELMVSLALMGLLAGSAALTYSRQSVAMREDQLRRNLQSVRIAVRQFKEDTGLWPRTLSDLTVTTAPAQGVNALGSNVALDSRNYRGPYLRRIPIDPVSRNALLYVAGPAGYVGSSATGSDSRGVAWNTY